MTTTSNPFSTRLPSPTDQVSRNWNSTAITLSKDEPDPRPARRTRRSCRRADIFDALVSSATDTLIEPDLDDLLWGAVHLFHRTLGKIERRLDDNEQAQKRSQREQDGSEVRSSNSNAFSRGRDALSCARHAMDSSAITPPTPSSATLARLAAALRVPGPPHALTSALIDSRDFLAAKRRAEIEPLTPAGPKVAFTGGPEFNDHRPIWDNLDQVHAKHPDMVLLARRHA